MPYNGLGESLMAISAWRLAFHPDDARIHVAALEGSPWPWYPSSPVHGPNRGRLDLIAPVVGVGNVPPDFLDHQRDLKAVLGHRQEVERLR